MSKFVHIDVSASISTDFELEVPDNADEAKIRELAERQVILPHTYPQYVYDNILSRMGIRIHDSMLKSWILDELNYLIDGGNYTDIEGE